METRSAAEIMPSLAAAIHALRDTPFPVDRADERAGAAARIGAFGDGFHRPDREPVRARYAWPRADCPGRNRPDL